MSNADIRVVPYESTWFESYRTLAEREWGRGCRQANPEFLRWAHKNPIAPPKGRSAIWLGVQEQTVIGCIHTMRLPWRVGDELVDFPTLHDWLVAPEHRTGVGTMLLTTALRGERHAFIPAAAGELEQVYEALRCEPADSMWFRHVLRPTAGALRFGLQKALKRSEVPRPRLRLPPPGHYGEFALTIGADASLQAALLERLHRDPPTDAGAWPHWSAESFAWRFFDPEGPWHLVLHEGRGSRVENFGLLSVGVRHGLAIGRLMLASFTNFESFDRLARAASRVLTPVGVHVLLAFTLDPRQRVAFARAGWRTRPGPRSFFSHFPRKQRFGAVAAGAEIADFGFESLAERGLIP
jgi:hypothetical protein